MFLHFYLFAQMSLCVIGVHDKTSRPTDRNDRRNVSLWQTDRVPWLQRSSSSHISLGLGWERETMLWWHGEYTGRAIETIRFLEHLLKYRKQPISIEQCLKRKSMKIRKCDRQWYVPLVFCYLSVLVISHVDSFGEVHGSIQSARSFVPREFPSA